MGPLGCEKNMRLSGLSGKIEVGVAVAGREVSGWLNSLSDFDSECGQNLSAKILQYGIHGSVESIW